MLVKRCSYLVIACCCLALLGSGCRNPKGPNDGDEMLLVGDVPISDRVDGIPIRDVMLESVLFAYDSAAVAPSERYKVTPVSSYLRQNRRTFVVLEGNCDERGSREYNMALGERRALSVRDALMRFGISSERLQTRSYGEEVPANPQHNERAWRENRRVEFSLYRYK